MDQEDPSEITIIQDPTTNQTFQVNKKTKEVQPVDDSIPLNSPKSVDSGVLTQYWKLYDKNNQMYYYFNTQTKKSQWERPEKSDSNEEIEVISLVDYQLKQEQELEEVKEKSPSPKESNRHSFAVFNEDQAFKPQEMKMMTFAKNAFDYRALNASSSVNDNLIVKLVGIFKGGNRKQGSNINDENSSTPFKFTSGLPSYPLLKSLQLNQNQLSPKKVLKIHRIIQLIMGDRRLGFRERQKYLKFAFSNGAAPNNSATLTEPQPLQVSLAKSWTDLTINSPSSSEAEVPDAPLEQQQRELENCLIQYLLYLNIQHQQLRDETFCFLVRQMSSNSRWSSFDKGWQCMVCCLGAFPPSKELDSYLRNWISDFVRIGRGDYVLVNSYLLGNGSKGSNPDNRKSALWQRLSTLGGMITGSVGQDISGIPDGIPSDAPNDYRSKLVAYSKYCLDRLQRAMKRGPRGKVPSLVEIQRLRISPFEPSLFGESLQAILQLDKRKAKQMGLTRPPQVPRILSFLTKAVFDLGGCKTEGIFRVPGDSDEVTRLRLMLENGEWTLKGKGRPVDDPSVPASLMKLWLRELLDPIMPSYLYDACLRFGEAEIEGLYGDGWKQATDRRRKSNIDDPEQKNGGKSSPNSARNSVEGGLLAPTNTIKSPGKRTANDSTNNKNDSTTPPLLQLILDQMPETSRATLIYLVDFLRQVSNHHSETKMSTSNIAMVFAPNILRCPSEDLTVVLENSKFEQGFVRNLILWLDTRGARELSGDWPEI